jgi:hypothetical protein
MGFGLRSNFTFIEINLIIKHVFIYHNLMVLTKIISFSIEFSAILCLPKKMAVVCSTSDWEIRKYSI